MNEQAEHANVYWPHHLVVLKEKGRYDVFHALKRETVARNLSYEEACQAALHLNPAHIGRGEARALMRESRKERPRFAVTYTPYLSSYRAEIEGAFPSLADAEAESEEVYEHLDLAEYEVDSHDEQWEPLNLQARWLQRERKREEEPCDAG
jgi:hypothetical protein